MQTVWDPENSTLQFLAGNIFTSGELSPKQIVYNLRQFKESFMVAVLDVLKKLEIQENLRKVIKVT